MAWADERILRMDAALNRIEVVARELQEIDSIVNALIEAATMPSSTALRTIVRALAFRLGDMSAKAEDNIIEIVNTGLTVPEAEKECAE